MTYFLYMQLVSSQNHLELTFFSNPRVEKMTNETDETSNLARIFSIAVPTLLACSQNNSLFSGNINKPYSIFVIRE